MIHQKGVRHAHLFVVLRLDEDDEHYDLTHAETVHGIKAFASESGAREEVRRLMKLNGTKGCIYYYVLVRIPLAELRELVHAAGGTLTLRE